MQRPRFLLSARAPHADADEREALHTGDRISRLAHTGPAGTTAIARTPELGDALSPVRTPDLVRSLPVGGPVAGLGGGIAELARQAALEALSELVPDLPGSAATSAPSWGAPGPTQTSGPAGVDPSAGAPVPELVATGAGGPSGAGPVAANGAGTGGTGPTAAAPQGPGGAGVPGGLPDMDRLVEALEQRLLAEVERRGGRWNGVF